ncbi:MAG: hypothetical protein EXR66_03275 [Dehalococcoidia bacterium]|nr:hypothetical protein [Dehalococcoidia bacterium]
MDGPIGGGTPSSRLSVALYASTIFLGAFLLFQVQPLIGKYALPWFGGSAGVWATALLFCQLFLLLGYAYAHALATWFSPRGQAIVHLSLLALALATLPIIPSEALRPDGSDAPVRNLILMLGLTIGAPYLLLSANGPLVQHWFARQHAGRSPYRLYALSNVASLLALLAYPLWFERAFPLGSQAWLWSGTYGVFTVLCALLAFAQLSGRVFGASATLLAAGDADAPAVQEPIEWWKLVLWVLLPAVAAALLLSTTTHLTQDIAPVPMLWVLPLSIYLVTFILTFDSDRWYYRPLYTTFLLISLVATTFNVVGLWALPLVDEVALLLGTIYFAGMVCHGELVALRPGPGRLTLFYLAISAGGALGGGLVALAAPVLLNGYWEFHISLVAAAAVAGFALTREWRESIARASAFRTVFALATAIAFGLAIGISEVLWTRAAAGTEFNVFATRSFYGALRVSAIAADDPVLSQLQLVHGQTLHGIQFEAADRRRWHTTYYGEASGVGAALTQHPSRLAGRPLRVGLVGLGTGTLASYLEPGDYGRFYEINPQVLDVANSYFSYLPDAQKRGADLEVLLGDARIVLDRQLAASANQRFDVLAVDAFSSDSIPIHLLTEEAMELYQKHMAPGGVIAIHVSNRFLDLVPVVRALADARGLGAYYIENPNDGEHAVNLSQWVLVTDNQAFLANETVRSSIRDWPEDARPSVLWTDDYSALLPLLKF